MTGCHESRPTYQFTKFFGKISWFSATSSIRFFMLFFSPECFDDALILYGQMLLILNMSMTIKGKNIPICKFNLKKIEVFSPITTIYLGRQHSLTEIHLSQNADHWEWIVLAIILLKLMSIIIFFRDKRFYQAHFASHQSQMPEKICAQFSRSSIW